MASDTVYSVQWYPEITWGYLATEICIRLNTLHIVLVEDNGRYISQKEGRKHIIE